MSDLLEAAVVAVCVAETTECEIFAVVSCLVEPKSCRTQSSVHHQMLQFSHSEQKRTLRFRQQRISYE